MKVKLHIVLVLLCLFGLVSCGGGSGSGDSGRSTDTAIKVVHGSVDGSPVTLSVDGAAVQNTSFANAGEYFKVKPGAHPLSLHMTNAPGNLLTQLTSNFEDETEYSLFIHGSSMEGNTRYDLIKDTTARPKEGNGNVRVMNAYYSGGSLNVKVKDLMIPKVTEGTASSYHEIPIGLKEVTVTSSSGEVLDAFSFTLEEQCEASLLITGSDELKVIFSKVIKDCD